MGKLPRPAWVCQPDNDYLEGKTRIGIDKEFSLQDVIRKVKVVVINIESEQVQLEMTATAEQSQYGTKWALNDVNTPGCQFQQQRNYTITNNSQMKDMTDDVLYVCIQMNTSYCTYAFSAITSHFLSKFKY